MKKNNDLETNLQAGKVLQTRRFYLHRAGWTDCKLSARLGVKRSTISMTMTGRRNTAWLKAALPALCGVNYETFWQAVKPELSAADVEKLVSLGLFLGEAK